MSSTEDDAIYATEVLNQKNRELRNEITSLRNQLAEKTQHAKTLIESIADLTMLTSKLQSQLTSAQEEGWNAFKDNARIDLLTNNIYTVVTFAEWQASKPKDRA